MSVKKIYKSLEKLNQKKQRYIAQTLLEFDKEIKTLQEKLLNNLFIDILNELDVKDNKIVFNSHNIRISNKLNKTFDEFVSEYLEGSYKEVANKMVELTTYTNAYYKAMGIEASAITKISKGVDTIISSVGIDKAGNIINGSYLDLALTNQSAKTKAAEFVLRGITNKAEYKEFQKGFAQIIKGDKEVTGRMLADARRYIHDIFFQLARQLDDYYAQQLDLKHFVYQGELITTSRPFCEKRAGKIFTREEAEEWKELEWNGKTEPYDPLIDLGGYNCRHWTNWVSEEIAEELQKMLDYEGE
jgi:hypothetical protein